MVSPNPTRLIQPGFKPRRFRNNVARILCSPVEKANDQTAKGKSKRRVATIPIINRNKAGNERRKRLVTK